jgi:hypothetical protein
VRSGVARFAGHRVEVEWLGVVAIDEVASSPQRGKEEQRALGHPVTFMLAPTPDGCIEISDPSSQQVRERRQVPIAARTELQPDSCAC